MLYTVNNDGNMTILSAPSEEFARREAMLDFGRLNIGVLTVRPATEEDKAWYQAMGGCLPVDAYAKVEKKEGAANGQARAC